MDNANFVRGTWIRVVGLDVQSIMQATGQNRRLVPRDFSQQMYGYWCRFKE